MCPMADDARAGGRRERARSFLRRNGMEPEDFDLQKGLEEYLREMRRGLSGEPSSLEMIPTYIELAAGQLRYYLPDSSRLGFCFSFSMEQLPNKDGRVNNLGKEVKAPEVLGALVGENLAAALREAGHRRPMKIVIVNDTVTAMLAGMAR